MATDVELEAAEPADEVILAEDEYRELSSAAVSSLALGLLGVLALFEFWMLALPIGAVALAAYALRQMRLRGDELAGRPMAKAGLILGVLFFAAGSTRLSFIYATEVPEGYTRISYAPLQPPGDDLAEIPDSARALDGQKVFIKGYVYPGAQMDGIRVFLLVRDQGTCCFGGDPKISDRIQVALDDPEGMTYSTRLQKLAGIFRVRPSPRAIDGPGGVYYHLEEAMLR